MDFERRFRNVRQAMQAGKIDLAVFGVGPDFQYLTCVPLEWRCGNDRIHAADSLFVPLEGEPVLVLSGASETAAEVCWIGDIRIVDTDAGYDAGYDAVVKQIAAGLTFSRGCVAVGAHLQSVACLAIMSSFDEAAFVAGGTLTSRSRMIKEPDEVDALRKCAELTDRVMREAVRKIDDGISMRQLRLDIEMLARGIKATAASFPPVAGFIRSGGEATGSIYGYEMDEGLEKGTTIFFDLGFAVDGYCSDWGRSVYWGRPGREVREGYAALQRAVVETIAGIRPNFTRACDVFPSIEESLDRQGFGRYLRARLPYGVVGHQIGIEVHEDPWLNPENQHTLEPGMVMCIEPKLWRDGDFYLRVEDMVLINEHGAESLTIFDRELFEL